MRFAVDGRAALYAAWRRAVSAPRTERGVANCTLRLLTGPHGRPRLALYYFNAKPISEKLMKELLTEVPPEQKQRIINNIAYF